MWEGRPKMKPNPEAKATSNANIANAGFPGGACLGCAPFPSPDFRRLRERPPPSDTTMTSSDNNGHETNGLGFNLGFFLFCFGIFWFFVFRGR